MLRAHAFSDDRLAALPPSLAAGAETFDSLLPLKLVIGAVAVDAVLAGGAKVDVTRVVIFLRVDSLDGQVDSFLWVSTSTMRVVLHVFHVVQLWHLNDVKPSPDIIFLVHGWRGKCLVTPKG